MTVTFFILVALTLVGAVAALALRNLVHCALALAAALAGLAAIYLLLGAEFVGLAQILVYVGAVAILIVFAILLTGSRPELLPEGISGSPIAGIVVAAAVFAILAWAVVSFGAVSSSTPSALPPDEMRRIGEALMHRFVLPLEVMALMLTAALIGAVILALEEKQRAR